MSTILTFQHGSGFIEDALDWCRGQSWGWRAAILLYLAYIGYHHLIEPLYSSLFSGVTLVVHEAGHLLFRPFGEFLMVAGGSITQVAVPVLAGFGFLRQRDYFAVSVAGGWLAVSLCNLATYVSDAIAQGLPLVGFSSDPIHDWHYLLGAMNLLPCCGLFATLIRCIAFIVLLLSLGFGAWLCRRMAVSRDQLPRY